MAFRLGEIQPQTKPFPGQRVNSLHPLAPKHCWVLSEGGGSLLNDSIGALPSHRATNSPGWIEGVAGPALTFVNASQQGVVLQDTFLIMSTSKVVTRGNGPWTLSVQFRSTDAGTSGRVLYAEASDSSVTPFVELTLNDTINGRVTLQIRDDAGSTKTLTADIGAADGLWHTVTGVNEGPSNSFRLCYDGYLRTSTANTLGACSTNNASLAEDRLNANSAGWLTGDINFAMVWDRALSAAEVFSHFRSPYQMFLPTRVSRGITTKAGFPTRRARGAQ